MQALLRIVAFALVSSLMILSVVGADDKDKKADPPKGEAKKADAKKDEPAKKDESAKKDSDKKTTAKPKLPPRKGKFKDVETDKDAAERKLLRQPKVPATVVGVVEDKKILRLRLTIPYVKINEGQLQNYYKAQNVQQMLQAQAQLYELAKVDKDVEWSAAEDFKVRMNYPPPQFDDKGKPKRYTRKELQDLKGNDKLPGYPAQFADIKAGQIVQVTLQRKKSGPRPAKRGKDADEVSADDLPKISMIIIVAEPKN